MKRSKVVVPKGKHYIEKEMKILAVMLVLLAILTYVFSSNAISNFEGDFLQEETIGKQLVLISFPLSVLILIFMYKLKEVTGFKILFYWTLIYTVYNMIGIYFFGNPLGFTSSRNNSFNGALLLWVYLPIIFMAFYRYESKMIKIYFISLLFLSTAYSPFAYYNSFSYYFDFFFRNYISPNGVISLSQGYFNFFLFFGLLNSIVLIKIYYKYRLEKYIEEHTIITGDFSDFMKIRAKQ